MKSKTPIRLRFPLCVYLMQCHRRVALHQIIIQFTGAENSFGENAIRYNNENI